MRSFEEKTEHLERALIEVGKENKDLKEATRKNSENKKASVQEQDQVVEQLISEIQDLKKDNLVYKTKLERESRTNSISQNEFTLPAKSNRQPSEVTSVNQRHQSSDGVNQRLNGYSEDKLANNVMELILNKSKEVNENSLFQISAPADFEPKDAFRNYRWFLSLESYLEEFPKAALAKKTKFLKKLVTDNANGWLEYEGGDINSFKSWTEVREAFFGRFVTSKHSARDSFNNRFIEG